MKPQLHSQRDDALTEESEVVRQILTAIRSVRFGQVRIIIQDSRVVQIDTTEKLRLV